MKNLIRPLAIAAALGVAGVVGAGYLLADGPKPADTPLTPGDLCMTVHHCAGMTSEQITGMGLTPAGRVIEELF